MFSKKGDFMFFKNAQKLPGSKKVKNVQKCSILFFGKFFEKSCGNNHVVNVIRSFVKKRYLQFEIKVNIKRFSYQLVLQMNNSLFENLSVQKFHKIFKISLIFSKKNLKRKRKYPLIKKKKKRNFYSLIILHSERCSNTLCKKNMRNN